MYICVDAYTHVQNKSFMRANIDSQSPNTDAIMMNRKEYKATTTNLQTHAQIKQKSLKHTSQLSPKRVLGTALGPLQHPGTSRTEKETKNLVRWPLPGGPKGA